MQSISVVHTLCLKMLRFSTEAHKNTQLGSIRGVIRRAMGCAVDVHCKDTTRMRSDYKGSVRLVQG